MAAPYSAILLVNAVTEFSSKDIELFIRENIAPPTVGAC